MSELESLRREVEWLRQELERLRHALSDEPSTGLQQSPEFIEATIQATKMMAASTGGVLYGRPDVPFSWANVEGNQVPRA